jgi:hypothetical protein
MRIQVSTDVDIEGHEALAEQVRATVVQALERLAQYVTRVEVHLGDRGGAARERRTGQPDKRCMLEARLQGHPPMAVTAQAATLDQAVQGAADKLVRMIDSALGRSARYHRARFAPAG